MKSQRKLFIINDYVNTQKDEIYRILKKTKKDYLFLDGQPFCNNVFELRYYRQVWLELCKSVSEQLDVDIAFCGALAPDMIQSMDIADFFDVHWLTVLCGDEEKIRKRHEASRLQESVDIILQRNKWTADNYPMLFPQVKLLDITEMADELVAAAIDDWIVSHTCHQI